MIPVLVTIIAILLVAVGIFFSNEGQSYRRGYEAGREEGYRRGYQTGYRTASQRPRPEGPAPTPTTQP